MTANTKESPLVPSKQNTEALRFITFNVNGVKTLFNYHPWNKLEQNFDSLFDKLEADIITLQELKLSPNTLTSAGGSIGNLKKFHSFISMPKSKRGYSGVGVFVRKCTPSLVIKAEEGLTGWLNSPDEPSKSYREREPSTLIGGYPSVSALPRERALELDSEGRCVCIEMPNNTVVISVYCPANSMGTDSGLEFKLEFLQVLLHRCFTLKHHHNKEVILMGDINACLDLIDSADGIQDGIKAKQVQPVRLDFERVNYKACIEFKKATPSRTILNTYTHPTLALDEAKYKTTLGQLQCLYDTTRIIQGRRMSMYTVWNTMTSARQSNYGSRIDLILCTDKLCDSISNADICPQVKGSDHCPVFTDFVLDKAQFAVKGHVSLALDAKVFYKLVQHRDISTLFGNKGKDTVQDPEKPAVGETSSARPSTSDALTQPTRKRKLEYVSRKGLKHLQNQPSLQQSISNFFFKENTKVPPGAEPDDMKRESRLAPPFSIESISNKIYGDRPNCLHNEPCQLKTSLKNPQTRGRKFWCCPRPLIGINIPNSKDVSDHRCDFFEWVHSKRNCQAHNNYKSAEEVLR